MTRSKSPDDPEYQAGIQLIRYSRIKKWLKIIPYQLIRFNICQVHWFSLCFVAWWFPSTNYIAYGTWLCLMLLILYLMEAAEEIRKWCIHSIYTKYEALPTLSLSGNTWSNHFVSGEHTPGPPHAQLKFQFVWTMTLKPKLGSIFSSWLIVKSIDSLKIQVFKVPGELIRRPVAECSALPAYYFESLMGQLHETIKHLEPLAHTSYLSKAWYDK